jgi:hypothetical protein
MSELIAFDVAILPPLDVSEKAVAFSAALLSRDCGSTPRICRTSR